MTMMGALRGGGAGGGVRVENSRSRSSGLTYFQIQRRVVKTVSLSYEMRANSILGGRVPPASDELSFATASNGRAIN